MPAPESIRTLVEKFSHNHQAYVSIDQQIDALVYELNGLIEEEIRIVEGKP